MPSEVLATGEMPGGGWSAEDTAAYKRLLEEEEAWALQEEQMARLDAEAEELRQELETIVLCHLGNVWLKGLAPRLAPNRRDILKDNLLNRLLQRYNKILAKKRAEGLAEESAHQATLRTLRRVSIKPESLTPAALRKGPKPRGYHKELPKLLPAYKRWLPKVRAQCQAIKEASDPEAELLKRIPEASGTRPSDRIIDGKVVPPFALAALIACSELGINLSLKRALEEIWRQKKELQNDPTAFTPEELKEWAKKDEEEARLKKLRDSFGPPAGLRDLWA